jgi:hypothetical protein
MWTKDIIFKAFQYKSRSGFVISKKEPREYCVENEIQTTEMTRDISMI